MREILHNFYEKSKCVVQDSRTYTTLLFIIIAFTSFGLGKLSVLESGAQGSIVYMQATGTAERLSISSSTIAGRQNNETAGQYVASKSGKKYYPVGCSGINRIKEENRIYFDSKEEAEASGRTVSDICAR